MGLRLRDLGTDELSWRDLAAIVQHLPLSSALARSTKGAESLWDVHAHLMANVSDLLSVSNWQRGGGKGSRPKPIKRPGADDGSKKIGSDPIPAKDFNNWWENG